MEIKYKYLFTAIALLALVSCEDMSDIPHDNGLVPIEFHVPTTGQVQTKETVEGTTFPERKDPNPYPIGVIINDSGTDNELLYGYDEIKADLRVSSTGVMWSYQWAIEGQGRKEFSELNVLEDVPMDIYAYYPYTRGNNDYKAVAFNVQDMQDWMVAEPVLNTTANKDEMGNSRVFQVYLKFRHLMTCIQIDIQNKYTGPITIKDIKLTDKSDQSRIYNGTIDLRDGTIAMTSRMSSVTFLATKDVEGKVPLYLIIPEIKPYTGGLYVSFTIGDKTFEYELPTDDISGGFLQGKKYRYLFTIDNLNKFTPLEVDETWEVSDVDLTYTL